MVFVLLLWCKTHGHDWRATVEAVDESRAYVSFVCARCGHHPTQAEVESQALWELARRVAAPPPSPD